MHILYDARWIRTDGVFDGVSRYSTELASAMARQPDLQMSFLICDKRQKSLLPAGAKTHIIHDPNHPLKEAFAAFTINPIVRREGIDVVYSPFFMMGTVGRRYKLVLTIHDMIYFHHRTPPQWLPWHIRAGWWLFHASKWPMRLQLDGATAVATVSETARKELTASRMTSRPITTVYNAADFTPAGSTSFKRHESHDIVYMGAFTPYKNVECLIDAMSFVPTGHLHLLSKIPPARKKELTARARDREVLGRVTFHNGVSDEQYQKLLAQCRCLVTASRLEGFGLPIIEAQAAGVPVACSDTPIFREVAGRAAEFFDPDDPTTCARALEQLRSPERIKQLVHDGRENATRFTWQSSAASAVKLCKKITKK